MDSGNCSSEPEANNAPSPPSSSGFSGADVPNKAAHPLEDSAASSPSPKRSRRSVQKRIVSIPISETKGGAGEGAPPSDSWTWRKYGQKPIKGSPYPRGYYRCSSSKGCPARKQVERNSADPSMIVVTYSFDHNHPWPLPKNSHHRHKVPAEAPEHIEDQPPVPVPAAQRQQEQLISTAQHSSPLESTGRDEKLFDLIGEEERSLLLPDDGGYHWFSEVGSSPASTSPAGSDELLYGSAFIGGASACETATRRPGEEASVGGGEEASEDDSLFAGLEELPEYSFVSRRWLSTTAAWGCMGTT